MHIKCDLDRVTFDGTPETLPKLRRPVVIWLCFACCVGYRDGADWMIEGASPLDIEPSDTWAYISPFLRAVHEAVR